MRTDNLIISGNRLTVDMDKLNNIENILDADGNIHASRVEVDIPIDVSSGGTGINSYNPGDMLVASTTSFSINLMGFAW